VEDTQQTPQVVLPQPDQISEREKEDAMGAYLMMFAAWGLGLPMPLLNLLAAVIYHMINRKKSPFVAFHSLQSLLTQVMVSLLNAGLIAWTIMLLGPRYEANRYYFTYLVFVLLWNLGYMVFSIIACVQARKGRFYYFWVFGRMAFAAHYGPRARRRPRDERNLPPQ
jgi:uncharacterized membrane protein